ncbi:unnamed protein product [Mycena citricolor]|uniref:Protein kinase domain-containing protein n=1 Tax=Mycena citricolor TaxID=2018698 RepID=A0AAD2Q7F6_9AGAR|nr:unnamed protein product [Mycena citricolor]
MPHTPRDNAFRRFFSSDNFGRAPPLVTDSPSPDRRGTPDEPVDAASSPAALFLSAFSPSSSSSGRGSQEQSDVEPEGEGSVVGQFTLGPIIAHGGFSTIRRATSLSNGSTVAVKIVPKEVQKESSTRKRIAHEETIWTMLSHEHILPLFACVHTPTADCFVTQLCPGGSLFDVLRAGVPPVEETGRMFRQVVRGLRYLHNEAGIVHRDVKLENVLIDEAGVCRIADFGMAVQLDDSAVEDDDWPEGLPVPKGAGVQRAVSLAVPRHASHRFSRPTAPSTPPTDFQPGSLPYAAPELLRSPPLTTSVSMSGKTKAEAMANANKSASAFVQGKSGSTASPGASTVTPPAPAQDIWALGVMLFALLVGRLPFVDSFEPRLVLKILDGNYTPPPHASKRTLSVLRGCLSMRVTDRWGIERIDEAAWAVGGEDSASASHDGDHSHMPRHHARAPFPAPLPTHELDRGRAQSGAAARRAERSASRAPYDSYSRSRSMTRSRTTQSGSRSRSRSRSPGPPRTPVDLASPSLVLPAMAGLGIGFPGKGRGRTLTEEREPEPEPEPAEAEVVTCATFLSPGDFGASTSTSTSRRAGSTPPVAWRDSLSGSGRTRSLSGTGAV